MLYHEKQSRKLCALHTLNNLFQDPNAYTYDSLECIARELDTDSFINPHKSPIGLGNYDVNVLSVALERKEHALVWLNKSLNIENLNLHRILGFIVNCPATHHFFGVNIPFYKPRHWFPVRNFQFVETPGTEPSVRSGYYNLDSNFEEPKFIGDAATVSAYLNGIHRTESKLVFVVVTKEVADSKEWLQENNSGN